MKLFATKARKHNSWALFDCGEQCFVVRVALSERGYASRAWSVPRSAEFWLSFQSRKGWVLL